MTVTIGLETLLDSPTEWLRPGERVGLLSNPTGTDRRLRSSIDLLHDHPGVDLVRLYGPEHGIRGDAQAGIAVEDGADPRTALPVTSLYSRDHTVDDHAFTGIDVLLIDLQDAGVRFYTYLASANSAARRAATTGARVLLLDRPNPIAWMGVFGNRVAPGHGSIVGIEGLPIAHACTSGELLRHLARRDGRDLPDVVPLQGWDRAMRWRQIGLPWVAPSPNLPTLDSAHIYPATCLIEGTSLSEGRGTTLPFELIGHPGLDPYALSAELLERGTSRYLYRPATFVPTFSKHEGVLCRGVQVHPDGDHHPSILALGPVLLAAARRHTGDGFAWVTFGEVPFIDSLGGSSELRETVDNDGDIPALLERWATEADAFIAAIEPDLLYGPLHRARTGDQG